MSQGRSENSDQSGPLHPMLPNADRMSMRPVHMCQAVLVVLEWKLGVVVHV